MLLHKHNTNRLFYNKYPYKIVISLNKQCLYRRYNLKIPKILYDNGIHIQDSVLKNIDDYNIRYRLESNHLSVFLTDKQVFDRLTKELSKSILEVWEPQTQDQLELLLTRKKIILVDKLPHRCYKHKLYLKKIPLENKRYIFSWLKTFPKNNFKISKTTERYLLGNVYWTSNPFILVKDDQLLTLVCLKLNDFIDKREEYVLKSSINT